MPSRKMDAQERKWRAESDLRTLNDAEDIKRDRARFSAARGQARKQITGLRRIAGGKR